MDRKEKRALLNLYRKLPTQNQLIIKAVTNAKNIHNPTTHAITLEYQKLTQTPTPETWITQKLDEAENAGTIKKILINNDDNPALAWKSQVPQKTSLLRNHKKTKTQPKTQITHHFFYLSTTQFSFSALMVHEARMR
jgi:hypothetical protein